MLQRQDAAELIVKVFGLEEVVLSESKMHVNVQKHLAAKLATMAFDEIKRPK